MKIPEPDPSCKDHSGSVVRQPGRRGREVLGFDFQEFQNREDRPLALKDGKGKSVLDRARRGRVRRLLTGHAM
jgi:hypothetical protein